MNENSRIHGIENIPHPYNGWVKQRNGKMAELISDILAEQGVNQNAVTVATRAITPDERSEIKNSFYGTVVSSLRHVGKNILHPDLQDDKGSERIFSQTVQEQQLVLPGISISSSDDLIAGYNSLRKKYVVRAKRTDESDGNGQYELRTRRRAKKLALALREEIGNEGLVLEAQIRDPKTISIGFSVINNSTYSFIAHQKDQQIMEYDEALNKKRERNRYQGAEVTVVKGDMTSLIKIAGIDQQDINAIRTASLFYEAYVGALHPDAQRISFDYMYGAAKQRFGRRKNILGGITDITARPGGTDPAILLAVKEFQTDPHLTAVSAEVSLDYDGVDRVPPHAELFIDDPHLRVYAYITARRGTFQLLKREITA